MPVQLALHVSFVLRSHAGRWIGFVLAAMLCGGANLAQGQGMPGGMEVTFCNRGSRTVRISTVVNATMFEREYQIAGWYDVEPDDCYDVNDHFQSFSKLSTDDNLYIGFANWDDTGVLVWQPRITGRAPDNARLTDREFCVNPDDQFTRRATLSELGRNCPTGWVRVPFHLAIIGDGYSGGRHFKLGIRPRYGGPILARGAGGSGGEAGERRRSAEKDDAFVDFLRALAERRDTDRRSGAKAKVPSSADHEVLVSGDVIRSDGDDAWVWVETGMDVPEYWSRDGHFRPKTRIDTSDPEFRRLLRAVNEPFGAGFAHVQDGEVVRSVGESPIDVDEFGVLRIRTCEGPGTAKCYDREGYIALSQLELHGSTVRFLGSDADSGAAVTIDGESITNCHRVPTDTQGICFVAPSTSATREVLEALAALADWYHRNAEAVP